MTYIKAQTTQTLKMVWKYKDTLSKEDFVRALTNLLPNGAMIIDLAIDVATRTDPDTEAETVLRTLTITYATSPLLANIRWCHA